MLRSGAKRSRRMFNQSLAALHGAMVTVTLLAGPLLGAALIIGVVVGLFQAVTQLSDMTLTFLPKLVVIGGILWIAGPWYLHVLIQFAQSSWTQAGSLHP